MNDQRLICEGLWKGYGAASGRVEVLRDVAFTAEPGRFTFILGPSGSGKSTLLSILAGILRPDAGSVRLGASDPYALSAGARTRFRGAAIGVAPQRDHLIPSLTARENAALGLLAQGVGRREALRVAEARLARLGLADRAGSKPRALSIGQRQRVALARALAPSPRLLLCDEPTAALDAAASAVAFQLLRESAAEQARITVVVTHDESLVDEGDAVLRLAYGALSPGAPNGPGKAETERSAA